MGMGRAASLRRESNGLRWARVNRKWSAVAPQRSRYVQVSRRAMLKGLTAAAAAGVVGGCATSDKQVFVTPSAEPWSAGAETPAAETTPVAATQPAAGGAALPASASMAISFTFAAGQDGGGPGPARNPYIAVWIEDTNEEMVSTVSLWHLQQNERWLGELKRWYTVSGGYETNTSATRVAGSYTVKWDGVGREGTRVAAGDYFVCIEGAREHGPYELIREPITLGTQPAEKTLTPQGELTAASVAYTV